MPDNRLEKTRKSYCIVNPVSSRVCEDGTQGCEVQHLTKEERERRFNSFTPNFKLKRNSDGTVEQE